MRRGGPGDPSTATQVMWTGIFCTALGLVFLAFGVWAAIDDVRQNGKFNSNAIVGLAIVGGGGLMFLLIGGACTYGGWRDRERAIAIRDATTVAAPPVAAAWKPPPGVTTHFDGPLDIDLDFFVPPPPEIGEVLSADTSLRFGAAGRTRAVNAARALAVGLFVGALVWLLMKQLEPKDPSAWWIGAALFGWIGGTIAWAKVRFRHACCYVGRNGVARFVASGDRGTVTGERFLFRDAADVKETRTARDHGWTDFRFDWLDADGAAVFQIAGAYWGHFTGRNPWTDVLYQWGQAAVAAWRNRASVEA
jgi:hypothetical protein